MDVEEVSLWMKEILEKDECLYQDDVVDYLVKSDENQLLRENSDGNQWCQPKHKGERQQGLIRQLPCPGRLCDRGWKHLSGPSHQDTSSNGNTR